MRVLTTDSAGPKLRDRLVVRDFPMRFEQDYNAYYCRRIWSRDFSIGLLARLYSMIRWADVVHVTSVYSAPTIPTLLISNLLDKPVVWSPRGALQRWTGSSKPLIKYLWERICNVVCSKKHCVLHVTSKQEAEESLSRIKCTGAELIPNGVEIPFKAPKRENLRTDKLRLLFIGRLDPKKGIENLIQALSGLPPGMSLSVCGTGNKEYVDGLHKLAESLELSNRVLFSGHVEGKEKANAFWNSDVCVVPSFTENFAMVVAEALAHGVPVIASKGTPWKDLESHGCGLWVDNDPSSLAEAIISISRHDLHEMGNKGRIWMEAEFSWTVVGRRMLDLYKKLIAQTRPETL